MEMDTIVVVHCVPDGFLCRLLKLQILSLDKNPSTAIGLKIVTCNMNVVTWLSVTLSWSAPNDGVCSNILN